VYQRYARVLMPKALRDDESNLTFEKVMDHFEEFRLIFTTLTDRTAPTALLPIPQLVYIFAGKRDGGKCFPKDDEDVIEENCLVVGTTTRVLGLQAETKDTREKWAAALNWSVNLMRYIKEKDKLAQAQVAEPQVLDPILTTGADFTKHGRKNIRRVFIKCTPEHIYCLKNSDTPVKDCADPIVWDSVVDVLQGKQTLNFSKESAMEVPDSLCLSVMYGKDRRTLDLVAENDEQAYEWFHALSGYYEELREKYEKEYLKNLTAAKSDLEKERMLHAEEKKKWQDRLNQDVQELMKQRQAIEDSKRMKSLEADMLSVTHEKDVLMAKVQELMAQMEGLRNRLDDQLRLQSEMLVEQKELEGVKDELTALREEVNSDHESIELQSLSLQNFLNNKLNPTWETLHKSIQEDERSLTNENTTSLLTFIVSES